MIPVALWVGATALLVFLLTLVYFKLTLGRYEIKEDLTDKTVLITGPTSGIGAPTAIELARAGATIHLLCRNVQKGRDLIQQIVDQTDNRNVRIWEVDLSSMDSVRKFAEKFLADTDEPIDILINNAATAWLEKHEMTSEGLECTMATNHFGHFLLTNLLLDRIKASEQGRIINVSSLAHWFGSIDIEDLNAQKNYDPLQVYNNTKLANVLFTNELAKRLKGTKVTANALHPGAVDTDLYRHGNQLVAAYKYLADIFMKTPYEGAQTTLYCAAAAELAQVSGAYFSDCAPASTSALAQDPDLAVKLWIESEKWTALR